LAADIVLLTGGVSKGRFDFVSRVLKKLGVRQVFHRVRQRPGKPLWFGVRDNKLVFGLPGNPVSCLVCLHRYVIECLTEGRASARPSVGDSRPRGSVALRTAMRRGSLTVFQPVCDGAPVVMNTSGDFADLAKSDGFVEIPEGTGYVRRVRYWAWR